MILAQIDDMFFKFLDNPEALGFVGLAILAFIIERILNYRIFKHLVSRDQSDQAAENERQKDLIQLIGGMLVDIKQALDNNTEAFKQYALANAQLTKNFEETGRELHNQNVEIKESISQILLGVNSIGEALSDIKGVGAQEYIELRELIKQTVEKVEKIVQELPQNGCNQNTNFDSAGSSGGSIGDQ